MITMHPTEREKHFDTFIRKIIRDGLTYFERPAVYIENNTQGMEELYDLLNMSLPDKRKIDRTEAQMIYENGHNYAVTDNNLFEALQQLSKIDRAIILLCYWDRVKDYWIVRKYKISMRMLKNKKSAAINTMRKSLQETEE